MSPSIILRSSSQSAMSTATLLRAVACQSAIARAQRCSEEMSYVAQHSNAHMHESMRSGCPHADGVSSVQCYCFRRRLQPRVRGLVRVIHVASPFHAASAYTPSLSRHAKIDISLMFAMVTHLPCFRLCSESTRIIRHACDPRHDMLSPPYNVMIPVHTLPFAMLSARYAVTSCLP